MSTDMDRWNPQPETVARMTLDPYNPRDTVDGWAHMLVKVEQLSRAIAQTEFVPSALRGKPAAVGAAILAGRELGVGPMTALQHLHIIDGRPSMSALLMRALVLAHGHHIRLIESTATRCQLAGRRSDEDSETLVAYTLNDARAAGLDQKRNWRTMPADMLLARATARLCRFLFADVIGGMPYTAEELRDLAPGASPDGLALEAGDAEPATTTVQRASAPAPAAARPEAGPPPPAQPRAAGRDEPPLPDDEPAQPHASSETTRQRAIERARKERAAARPAAPHTDAAMQETVAQRGVDDTPLPQDEPETARADGPATREQEAKVFALLRELRADDSREHRLAIAQGILARRVTSFKELTRSEVSALIDTLERCTQSDDPPAYLQWHVESGLEHLRMVEAGGELSDADVVAFVGEQPEDDDNDHDTGR